VKIKPVENSMGMIKTVGEKPDQGQFNRQQKQEDQQRQNTDEPEFDVTDETVGTAIESFKFDPVAQASGLSAELNGQGPGLKVILKDGSGAILRQMSGEDFLRLREAVSKNGSKSGKILDQKL